VCILLCDFSAKQLIRGEPNVSYICSRYYRAPELIFGATDYTSQIGMVTIHMSLATVFWLTLAVSLQRMSWAALRVCSEFCFCPLLLLLLRGWWRTLKSFTEWRIVSAGGHESAKVSSVVKFNNPAFYPSASRLIVNHIISS